MAACGDGEPLPTVPHYGNAKARQQVQRDFNVRPRDQLAHHLDHDVFFGDQWQRHQQGCEELAGHIATHLHRRIQLQRGFANAHRREAVHTEVGDGATQLAQRVHQVSNGPLVHARYAVQLEVATQHCQRGRQGPNRCAGIAHEQVCLPVGELAI